ncbi:MAG TPA: C40 family peptidase [Gemmatirosa sp.]
MAPRRVLAAGACGALVLSARPAHAQSSVLLEGFAARTEQSSAPVFGGLALGGYSGPFGLRVSGSLNTAHDAISTPQTYDDNGYGCHRGRCPGGYGGYGPGGYGSDGGSSLRVAAWTADADLLFEPFRTFGVGRALLLGFSPYVFGGIGYYAARPAAAADTGFATVDYGVGVRHELLGWLGVTGEARFRRALRGDSTVLDFNRHNAQFRVGLTVSFGGGHTAHRASPVSPAAGVATGAATSTAEGPTGSALPGVPTAPPASMAAVPSRIVPRVLDLADGYLDTPYRAGGNSPAGFDAPGFVQYVFGREGITLPRTVGQLAQSGMTVSTRTGDLRPGDLVFFANDGGTPDHVAIYVGRNRIIHATASAGAVRYDVLGEGARGAWFASHLVTARRVVDGVADHAAGDVYDDYTAAVGGSAGRPDQAPPPVGGGPR